MRRKDGGYCAVQQCGKERFVPGNEVEGIGIEYERDIRGQSGFKPSLGSGALSESRTNNGSGEAAEVKRGAREHQFRRDRVHHHGVGRKQLNRYGPSPHAQRRTG